MRKMAMESNADILRSELLAGAEDFMHFSRSIYKAKSKYRKAVFDHLSAQVEVLAAKYSVDASADTWFGPIKVLFPYF